MTIGATQQVAIVTFGEHYVGPPAVAALLREGDRVLAHDLSFGYGDARAAFEAKNPGAAAAQAIAPEQAVQEALTRFGRIDAVVSNNVPLELVGGAVKGVDRTDFAKVAAILLVRPHAFAAAAIAAMVQGGGGRVVIITSGATTRLPITPPTAMRATFQLAQA